MNNFLNTISSSVLSKEWHHCSVEELKQLAHGHPYSGALQFLYAEKLREAQPGDLSNQWQKTLLYFNNPLFLQHLAATQGSASGNDPEKPVIMEEEETLLNHPDEEVEPEIPETETIPATPETLQTEPEAVSIPGLKIEPIDPDKAALSFTPYYTIDYFASQGIKLGDDIKPADRFGSQLKTFTSWLKEMRRLPEAEVVLKFSAFEQNKVEKMAQNSLTGENAITEAMAQVWIKQQNPQKAIDIYKKLSLQNPAKSAFFAAKIEFLKKQL